MAIDGIGSPGIGGYVRTGLEGITPVGSGSSQVSTGVPGLSSRGMNPGASGGLSFSATPAMQDVSPTLAAARLHMRGASLNSNGVANPLGRHHHASETFENVTAGLARGDALGALESAKNGAEDIFAGAVSHIPVLGAFITSLGGASQSIASKVVPGGSHLLEALGDHQQDAFDAMTTSPFA